VACCTEPICAGLIWNCFKLSLDSWCVSPTLRSDLLFCYSNLFKLRVP
jgi:hypothetical protein